MKVRLPGWATGPRRQWLWGTTGLIGIFSVIAAIGASGMIATFVVWAGWLAFPVLFLLHTICSSIVFALVAPGKKIGKRFGFDTTRFEKGFWKKIFETGKVLAIQIISIVLGPFVSALAIRFIGLSGKKAWMYALGTNAVTALIMVALYLGLGEVVLSFF